MSYRPITDIWFLARAKLKGGVKYYGAYLGGFPERARRLLGASIDEPMLHVCGGMARLYPYTGGFGPNDMTLDLDPATKPDFLRDARDIFPCAMNDTFGRTSVELNRPWRAILIDPPYTEVDAEKYAPGADKYPKPNLLIKNAMDALQVGRKVGLIHYIIPACPKNAKYIAQIGIVCGFNNRIRSFSVFEKVAE